MNQPVVVLSGGGAKAAAHAGAVRALTERGITPSRYVATSLGAVVAAALAAGLETDEIVRRLFHEAPQGFRPHPLAPFIGLYLKGLARSDSFREALLRVLPARTFGELKTPLTVTAVDLDTMRTVLFGEGGADVPLIDALAASCALPPYFAPVILDGRRLADGGLLGHLPLDGIGEPGGRPVIAIDAGPSLDDGAPGRPQAQGPALVRYVDESIGILMAQVASEQLQRWRRERGALLYVRPRMERNATFRTDRVRVYADEGYLAMRAELDALDSAGPAGRLPVSP